MKIVIHMTSENQGEVEVLPNPENLPIAITGYDISVTNGGTRRVGPSGFAECVPDGSQTFTLTLHPA